MGGINSYAASESSYKYSTVKGYEYKYYSDARAYSDSVRCGTYVGLVKNYSIPAGYMGALARAYSENGTLYATADWEYSGDNTAGMNIPVYAEGKGSYYSYGKVKMYNGDGYNTYETYKSPTVSTKISTFAEPYKINKNGETYGSGLQEIFLGEMPDLVKACGIGGTIGYVRAEDIETKGFDTPEQNIQNKNNNGRTVPLYDADGETVIGTFKIQDPKVEVELMK